MKHCPKNPASRHDGFSLVELTIVLVIVVPATDPSAVVIVSIHTDEGHGLAICKRMIELHGGRIGATNNPVRGATFWFELPKGS